MENKEIQKIIEGEVAKFQSAVSQLRKVLVEEGFFNEFKRRTVDLDKEYDDLDREIEALRQTYEELSPVVQAKAKVLGREGEEALAKGNRTAAEKKTKEVQTAEDQINSLLSKVDLKAERQEAIVGEKKTIAKKLFAEVYPLLPRTTHAVIEAMLDLLDGVWSGLEEYQRQTNTGLSTAKIYGDQLLKGFHKENLAPNQANNQFLTNRMGKWF